MLSMRIVTPDQAADEILGSYDPEATAAAGALQQRAERLGTLLIQAHQFELAVRRLLAATWPKLNPENLTLGQMLKEVRSCISLAPDADCVLAEALDIRNGLAHGHLLVGVAQSGSDADFDEIGVDLWVRRGIRLIEEAEHDAAAWGFEDSEPRAVSIERWFSVLADATRRTVAVTLGVPTPEKDSEDC